MLILVMLWAIKPLFKFIFPLGHRHGQGAHVLPFIGDSNSGQQVSEGSEEDKT